MTASAPSQPLGADRPRRLDPFETVFQVALLTFRRLIRGKRLIGALLVVALPGVLALALGRTLEPPLQQEKFFYNLLGFYHFRIAVPGVALLLASSFPWPESDEGTLTFWFTAPVPRWTVLLGRFLACLLLGLLVLPFSVLALGLPLTPDESAHLGGAMQAAVTSTLLAYPAYLALMTVVSTAFRKALVFGVVFVILENSLTFIPGSIARLTLLFYVRALLWPDISRTGRNELLLVGSDDIVTASTALGALLGVALVGGALSLLIVRVVEYRGKHAQPG